VPVLVLDVHGSMSSVDIAFYEFGGQYNSDSADSAVALCGVLSLVILESQSQSFLVK
jgi:hypothetical protein